MLENLIKAFAKVGLTLTPASRPINATNTEIFQLDIKRKKSSDPRSEYFEVWPGHEGNLAVVQASDKDLSQVVLMVKEPRREFFEEVRFFWRFKGQKTREEVLSVVTGIKLPLSNDWERLNWARADRDLVYRDGKWWVRHFTTARTRHFLMGRDERQLFMCQLPKPCTSVKEAHESLKAPTLVMYEGQAPGRTIRQGEWFFVNTSDAEQNAIEQGIKTGKIQVLKKVNIGGLFGRRGKPHTADELIVHRFRRGIEKGVGADAGGKVLNKRLARQVAQANEELSALRELDSNGKLREQGQSIFVRGSVRHSDHETVKFSKWRRVIRNAERDEGQSQFGGRWID